MSTPSTASALPPLNFHNSYEYPHRHPHHHQHPHHLLPARHTHIPSQLQYQPPALPTTTTNTTTPTSSASSSCSSTLSAMASRSQPVSRKIPKRSVDWDEYFKNGPPKEIIVIDDSPPPQPASSNGSRQQHTPSSRAAPMGGHYPLANGPGSHIPRHTDKKRRVHTSQYEPVYPDHSYSSTQTPHAYGSPTTVSAHSSTVSVNGNQSTAGTSLGSAGIGNAGPSHPPPTAAVAVPIGQKRKRVTRASQAAAANINLDAFASYHPPPRPPIKAKDVYVMQVQDVSNHFGAFKSPHFSRVAPKGNFLGRRT